MRASIAIAAGLIAAASAKTSTVTDTETWGDWTSTTTTVAPISTTTSTYSWADWESTTTTTTTTSSDPWADWESTTSTTTIPVAPVSTSTSSESWADWESTTSFSSVTTSTSAACPTYTATTPPAWFSLLPSDVLGTIEAKWTGAPPADWCYYTYSTVTLSTTAAPVSSTPWWPAGSSVAPASTGTGAWVYTSSTPVGPNIATWTGAANANAGSLALAGLAAVAAVVIA